MSTASTYTGKSEVITPQAKEQQTVSEMMKDYAEALPTVFAAQQNMAPQEASQQLSMLQQYGLPMGQAYQQIQQGLNPETYALQENLASRANEYITAGGVPTEMADQYRSQLSAGLGTQAGSPIGADYVSRGLMNQAMDWRKYYENMGMNLAGRQPLAQAQAPQYSNMVGSMSPQSALSYGASGYQAQSAAGKPFVMDKRGGGMNLGILGTWG